MVKYNLQINNGVEAFGTTGKTITVNEQPKNISLQFVAEELHHRMPLVPEDVIAQVLTGFQEKLKVTLQDFLDFTKAHPEFKEMHFYTEPTEWEEDDEVE